jgi:hypothetical protein
MLWGPIVACGIPPIREKREWMGTEHLCRVEVEKSKFSQGRGDGWAADTLKARTLPDRALGAEQ